MAGRTADPGDTIYALSSGRPPAAIAIVRVTGTLAADVVRRTAGRLPEPRVATLATFRAADGDAIDRGLLLWFPAAMSVTGEDLAEFHLHGSAAVVRAMYRHLDGSGLRLAQGGEFTRRGLAGGRFDTGEVEALGDLLAAETESERRIAVRRLTSGQSATERWADRLAGIAAALEATIDHEIEIDADREAAILDEIEAVRLDMQAAIAASMLRPRRRDIRIAIVGAANAGKSSLFNALLGDDAAIVSQVAGTTRDVNERPIEIGGLPATLVDVAGLRDTDDAIERIGIARARAEIATADVLLDLDDVGSGHGVRVMVSPKCDVEPVAPGRLGVSAVTGEGLADLRGKLVEHVATVFASADPRAASDDIVELTHAVASLAALGRDDGLEVVAAVIADVRSCLTSHGQHQLAEAALDTLFSRFCVGK